MISKKEKYPEAPEALEARGLFMLLGCFVALLCLLSFNAFDKGANWLGLFGHGLAWFLTWLFGISIYLIIGFTGWLGWKYLVHGEVENVGFKIFYFCLFVVSSSILLNLFMEKGMPIPGALKHKIITDTATLELPYPRHSTRYNLGGAPLYFLLHDLPTFNLQRIFSDVGVALTFALTAMVSLVLLLEVRLVSLIQAFAKGKKEPSLLAPEELEKTLTKAPPPLYPSQEKREIRIRTHTEKEERRMPVPRSDRSYTGDFTSYVIPPASLLTSPKRVDQPSLKKELKRQAENLEESLMSFGIEAKVGDINCGPTITSFEIHPAVGVKVQKITALESDIALNLQAKSIRIIAPIPGKAAVGVEIPSPYPQEVSFKEMLLGYQQGPRKMHIPILLGKTVTGENVVSDLAKMPHCLIAGATGSGKSVCINTLVMSIVMNARPDEIKLMMVDPKKVELTQYTGLPHMIAPVITEAHGAYAALNWLVKEMQTRYDILKQLGLRNIFAFNNRQINQELESSLSVLVPQKMYAIVAIIDEFADLMMASSSDLETPIARIAQMARAVGIHLVLATQRPSREVITGLIKANFPTRIAFKVASRVNSQIILDENGADSLLGNGDMLFLPPGSSHLVRSQGAYISDEDIGRVVQFITDQAKPNYLISSFDTLSRENNGEDLSAESSRDTLYDQARQIVVDTKSASTTFLQRKLKIGYARAASLMDELEANGVIAPQDGARPRRVLLGPLAEKEFGGPSED